MSDSYKSFENFIKEDCKEYQIKKGSDFEARLYLAYEEMMGIFKNEEHKLKYKIDQLKKELDLERARICELEKSTKRKFCADKN